MCAGSIQYSEPEICAGRFGPELDPELIGEYHPRYKLAPTQLTIAIREDPRARRTPAFLCCGLVPYWSKGPKQRYKMINACARRVAQEPAHRAAFRGRRYLIPAEGFHDWPCERRAKLPYPNPPRRPQASRPV